ncbi:MerR family transcriptional regulator [Streptomyces sp. NPDC050418]|uniref:MerR family transcriptional regulator n=1 Tax=Streptomyces sp. NPDC050418 TaxID=3365612 RepID=UPI003797F831
MGPSGEPEQPLRTAEAAAAAGYSVQQVRDLEAQGVIPAADRSPGGYRRFTARHVRALHAYRDLALAVGPVEARRTLREVRTLPPGPAAALVCALHAGLCAERDRALAARRALEAIRDEPGAEEGAAGPEKSTPDGDPDSMTITELAQALDVRTSALRFWESEGLVAPERLTTRAGTARRYPTGAIREARITAALRAGGYGIPEVRDAIGTLRDLGNTGPADGDADRTLAALDARIESLTARMLALLRTGTHLAESAESSGRGPGPDAPLTPAASGSTHP